MKNVAHVKFRCIFVCIKKIGIMTIDFNKPVKFTNPISEFEKTATFTVKNYNEVTGRVYIEHVCDLPIKPQQLVSVNDIENV